MREFKELQNESVKRVHITEAAYIGHHGNRLVVKKMDGVKLGSDGGDFETVNDDFEYIDIENEHRFKQFMKLMSLNKNSINMSIRVIIEETQIEEEPSKHK